MIVISFLGLIPKIKKSSANEESAPRRLMQRPRNA
jgi:hypothetical protein